MESTRQKDISQIDGKDTLRQLLLAVSYISTRVQEPNQQDMQKLMRIMMYLCANIDQPLVLLQMMDLYCTRMWMPPSDATMTARVTRAW